MAIMLLEAAAARLAPQAGEPKPVALTQAEIDSVVKDANLYNAMRQVALANGFESISDAIAKAKADPDVVRLVDRETMARAIFRKAQSVYRQDHDHFPITNAWETATEQIRDGWRAMADAALETLIRREA